eukprot:1217798-Amphidinium_carterae.2
MLKLKHLAQHAGLTILSPPARNRAAWPHYTTNSRTNTNTNNIAAAHTQHLNKNNLMTWVGMKRGKEGEDIVMTLMERALLELAELLEQQ